uniref:ethanolamine kinase n=1 Tax=Plectus sambesii TaxID=2011161 RepID=A0A914WUG4_9BILA
MSPKLRHFDVTLPLEDDDECLKQASKLAAEVKPDWDISALDFEFFTNGITNKVFCCTEKNLNEKIVCRVYGKKTELLIDREKELKNWQRLSDCDCASPLYATFDNGILCGYQPGETLTTDSIREPKIAKEIARAVAEMHRTATKKNGKQAESCYFHKLQGYLDNMPKKFDDAEKQKKFIEQFPTHDELVAEQAVLKETIAAVKPAVVFCHNDLLLYNILYDKESEKVNFIDYEYADFNYQAFDIGNHFCEYAGVENVDFSLYPSREYQLEWLKNYLEYYLERSPSEEEIERLYVQVNICAASAHFLWSVWCIIQAENSTIDFDFLSYAIAKNNEYKRMKKEFFHLRPPA